MAGTGAASASTHRAATRIAFPIGCTSYPGKDLRQFQSARPRGPTRCRHRYYSGKRRDVARWRGVTFNQAAVRRKRTETGAASRMRAGRPRYSWPRCPVGVASIPPAALQPGALLSPLLHCVGSTRKQNSRFAAHSCDLVPNTGSGAAVHWRPPPPRFPIRPRGYPVASRRLACAAPGTPSSSQHTPKYSVACHAPRPAFRRPSLCNGTPLSASGGCWKAAGRRGTRDTTCIGSTDKSPAPRPRRRRTYVAAGRHGPGAFGAPSSRTEGAARRRLRFTTNPFVNQGRPRACGL